MEAHYLAGGNVDRVVNALISADRANIELPWKRAAAIDLAGRDVLEAVQMSVNPKVIDTPRVAAVAKDGIQMVAVARVTVRANIERLVGGAGEETIIARVGEGTVSSIGSADSHKGVLENPDAISKRVLERGLDAGTAFEILSIDIADVDVGRNIGAELQTDQAEADKKIAQAEPRSAARWRSPRSRRCAPRSSRPRPRCRSRSPRRSAAATSASWTLPDAERPGRHRDALGDRRRPRPVNQDPNRHNRHHRPGRPTPTDPRIRPPRITTRSSAGSPEVRLAPAPHDRLPPPPAVRAYAQESVPPELPPAEIIRASPDRAPGDSWSDEQPARRAPSSRERLVKALSTPGAVRQAFLLSEVLGPPVALRTDTDDRHS